MPEVALLIDEAMFDLTGYKPDLHAVPSYFQAGSIPASQPVAVQVDATDFRDNAYDFAADVSVWTPGLFQAGGSVVEMDVGGFLSTTGIDTVLGAPTSLHGADNVKVGVETWMPGNFQPTLTE